LFERATEVRKALDMLHLREDVDSERLGLWGISQAGWAMDLVASRAPDIAFLVQVSCHGVTGVEQSAYLLQNQMEARGEPDDAVAAALAKYRAEHAELPAPTSSDGFWRCMAGEDSAYSSEPGIRPEEDGSDLIDPVPLLEMVCCPMLAVFGERDRNVPVTESAAAIKRAHKHARDRDLTIRILPDADHMLLQTDTGTIEETDRHFERYIHSRGRVPYPFAPGYVELIRDWVRARIGR
jgi:pimeloyl-ACP methyl ester carboxylesterase